MGFYMKIVTFRKRIW